MHPCPICDFPCREYLRNPLGGRYNIDCFRCGKYSIGDIAHTFIGDRKYTDIQIANISGYIRENQGAQILDSNLAHFERLQTPLVAEKASKLLTALGKRFLMPGKVIRIDCQQLETHLRLARLADGHYKENSFPDACGEASEWIAISWAASPDELSYLLHGFLESQRWLAKKSDGLVITPAGWQQIEDWKLNPSQSEKAFIAMSFAKDLLAFFHKGIEPGIRAAGYEAIRVDRIEHVNRIDDEIFAMIRKTKFVVADFTGNSMGVYFEAGFAQGLGRKVIWTVREDSLKQIHFDMRQFNFITWREKELETFAKALQNRIEGTIEPGPLKLS